MNERDFFYWLQGFFELSDAAELNRQQVKVIKEHMSLVAEKVTVSSVESLSGPETLNSETDPCHSEDSVTTAVETLTEFEERVRCIRAQKPVVDRMYAVRIALGLSSTGASEAQMEWSRKQTLTLATNADEFIGAAVKAGVLKDDNSGDRNNKQVQATDGEDNAQKSDFPFFSIKSDMLQIPRGLKEPRITRSEIMDHYSGRRIC